MTWLAGNRTVGAALALAWHSARRPWAAAVALSVLTGLTAPAVAW